MTKSTELTKIAILGVSGDAGSFSEEAGVLYAQKHNLEPVIKYLIDMEGVLRGLDAGEIDFGIFPVVNSRGGLVETAFDAMGRHLFKMVDKFEFEVHQCLMTLPGVDISSIVQIASHPQALIQCKNYLSGKFPHAKLIEWEDTAKAAKDLLSGLLPAATAVIAPSRSAEIYKLKLIEKNIEDVKPNITTFVVVKSLV